MINASDSIDYASQVVPLIEEIKGSKGFTDYLLPKLEKRKKALNDAILRDEMTSDERENLRNRYLELDQFFKSIDSDLRCNVKELSKS